MAQSNLMPTTRWKSSKGRKMRQGSNFSQFYLSIGASSGIFSWRLPELHKLALTLAPVRHMHDNDTCALPDWLVIDLGSSQARDAKLNENANEDQEERLFAQQALMCKSGPKVNFARCNYNASNKRAWWSIKSHRQRHCGHLLLSISRSFGLQQHSNRLLLLCWKSANRNQRLIEATAEADREELAGSGAWLIAWTHHLSSSLRPFQAFQLSN